MVQETALVVLTALVIATLIKTFLAQMFVIPSGSMEQTLLVSDRVMVSKITDVHRGDIIVFEDEAGWLPAAQEPGIVEKGLQFVGVLPASGDQYLIKRLIGMPGDHVACCDQLKRITVNGQPLDESSYLFSGSDGHPVNPSDITFDLVVPADRVFVLGDHRTSSADSRYHLCQDLTGDIIDAFPRMSSIQGPAKAVLFPFSRWRTFAVPATFASVPDPASPAPATAVITSTGC